jgi:hypothetical protein
MRINGDPVRAQRNLQSARERNRFARASFSGELPRRPDAGTLLRTLHVTDHLTGSSYELEIRQGERKNGITAHRFGNVVDCGGSYDGLFRLLRRKWALRWLTA